MRIGAIVVYDKNKIARIVQIEGDDVVLAKGAEGIIKVDKSRVGNEITELPTQCCWYCGGQLIWGSDFTFEDYCYEGEGLVSTLTCSNCGANVEYTLRDWCEDCEHQGCSKEEEPCVSCSEGENHEPRQQTEPECY